MNKLGKWGLIDIETTGVDAGKDHVIDLGFLHFEGTKLVKKYSSLVHTDQVLGQFIQKLTGIRQEDVRRAPDWSVVQKEMYDLEGHKLLAHNANFEKSFLGNIFDAVGGVELLDSLPFLALLNPMRSSLSLEQLLIELGIADSEEHRGLSDSIDLLKVLLVSVYTAKLEKKKSHFYQGLFSSFHADGWWWATFWDLSIDELKELAQEIEFDLTLFPVAKKREEQNLKPVRHDQLEFNSESIKTVLRDEPHWKELFGQYQFRPSQEMMALKVGQSFQHKIHALVQAPTGTGKTLGYLLPSALFSSNTGEKVLVATGTKALQKQIMNKDIPQLKAMLSLGSEYKIAELIGSQNHYCELSYRQKTSEDTFLFDEKYIRAFYEVLYWHNQNTPTYDETLNRTNIPSILKRIIPGFSEMDKEIAVDFRTCIGHKCPMKGSCTYIQGLREAKDAQIIIGNHALLLHWPESFERPVHIVVDEAHKLEQEATSAFSLQVKKEDIESFMRSLQNGQALGALFYLLFQANPNDQKIGQVRELQQQTYTMLSDHFNPLEQVMTSHFKKSARYSSQYWNELPFIGREESTDILSMALINHLESINNIISTFYRGIYPLASLVDQKGIQTDEQIMAWSRFESFWTHLIDMVAAFEKLLSKDEDYARSYRFHEQDGYEIVCAPVNVGLAIKEKILDQSESVVFTSATLVTGGNSFAGTEWLTGYSYLDSTKRYKSPFVLDSSFDYKNRARVLVSSDVPSLYSANFVKDVLKPLIPLIEDMGGRSLLLFSSYQRFELAREVLLKEFDGKIPVFMQGMGNNVVEEFKKSPSGILLGLESFGEGIDIPGRSLEFVFIDKIPDLRQDLVIQARRSYFDKHFGQEFTQYFLTHRAQSLLQKVGRLLRTNDDRGCVLIVDSRISSWKKDTWKNFQKLMLPYDIDWLPYTDSVEEVRRFLGVPVEKDTNLSIF